MNSKIDSKDYKITLYAPGIAEVITKHKETWRYNLYNAKRTLENIKANKNMFSDSAFNKNVQIMNDVIAFLTN